MSSGLGATDGQPHCGQGFRPRRRMGSGRSFRTGAFLAATVYAVIRLCPWEPCFPGGSIGASWMLAYHEAFAGGRMFGREIAFTYGPYGFLWTPLYYPATYSLLIAIRVALAAVFAWATWRVMGRLTRRPLVRAVACTGVAEAACTWWFTGSGPLRPHDVTAMFFVLPLYLLADYLVLPQSLGTCRARPRRGRRRLLDRLLRYALIVAVALSALIKFTFLVISLVVVAAIALAELRRRRVPWIVPSFLLTVLALWWAAGQPLGGLAGYFARSAEVARGYGAAMGAIMPSGGWVPVWIWMSGGASVALSLCIFVLAARWNEGRFEAALMAGALAAVLFLIWKSTLIRFDRLHVLVFGASLLAYAGTLWPAAITRRSGRLARWAGGITIALALVCTATVGLAGLRVPTPIDAIELRAASLASAAGACLRTLTGAASREHEAAFQESLHQLRLQFPLPRLEGTADVLPWRIAILFAHHLRYSPRPVIQSYSAYTPLLAEINACHFRSDQAPDHVLLEIGPIDARLPSLEDGPTWLELLARYRVCAHSTESMLLLERVPPRPYRLEPLVERQCRWDESVAVPSIGAGPIWCRIEIADTGVGRLAGLLLKPPPVYLHVALSGGVEKTYRLVPGMAEAGFLLSPLVDTPARFRQLSAKVRGDWPRGPETDSAAVTSLRLTVGGLPCLGVCYGRQMEVTLQRLHIADAPPLLAH